MFSKVSLRCELEILGGYGLLYDMLRVDCYMIWSDLEYDIMFWMVFVG